MNKPLSKNVLLRRRVRRSIC